MKAEEREQRRGHQHPTSKVRGYKRSKDHCDIDIRESKIEAEGDRKAK